MATATVTIEVLPRPSATVTIFVLPPEPSTATVTIDVLAPPDPGDPCWPPVCSCVLPAC